MKYEPRSFTQNMPKYSGWNIHYYRGALDAAFREIEEIEKALCVEQLRLRSRFEQMDMLVRALEESDEQRSCKEPRS